MIRKFMIWTGIIHESEETSTGYVGIVLILMIGVLVFLYCLGNK
jgi:hypothetical protein